GEQPQQRVRVRRGDGRAGTLPALLPRTAAVLDDRRRGRRREGSARLGGRRTRAGRGQLLARAVPLPRRAPADMGGRPLHRAVARGGCVADSVRAARPRGPRSHDHVVGGRRARLFVALRPFQVTPTSQFLNNPGGSAIVRTIEMTPDAGVVVNDEYVVVPVTPPDSFGAATFDGGGALRWMQRGTVPPDRAI